MASSNWNHKLTEVDFVNDQEKYKISWKYCFRPTMSLNILNCSTQQHFFKALDAMNGTGLQECPPGSNHCCNIFTKHLINDNYEKFVSLMKESQIPNWGYMESNDKRLTSSNSEFLEKYIFGSKFLRGLNLTLAQGFSCSFDLLRSRF